MNLETTNTDREFVISYMHYSGANRIKLSEKQWSNIYLRYCDGFGKINLKFANANCWDWSHVRDSSEIAFAKIAKHIRKIAPSELTQEKLDKLNQKSTPPNRY